MKQNNSLLPQGIRYILSPNAEKISLLDNFLLNSFNSYGYESIVLPLLEFEENIKDTNEINNSFRVLDAETGKMMSIRSDMTLQIGRIASNRLKEKVRPLRLMYSGDVLRVKGSTNRPSRGFKQYGIELIGVDNANADAEVILIATQSLQNLNCGGISVDICIPTLPKLVAESCGVDYNDIKALIEKRDVKKLTDINTIFGDLLSIQGDADKNIKKLEGLKLDDKSMELIKRTSQVIDILKSELADSGISITLDACETKGFKFQTGIGFTLFSSNSKFELGRGGRYKLSETKESSVGFSMYSDTLEEIVKNTQDQEKIFAPLDTDKKVIKDLRESGKIVVCALTDDKDNKKTAVNINCSHIIENNKVVKL
ncbi:MAG: ATP phosphoribosyltransferase regulatory subunit [Alphaproteobacteria bacterium]